MKPTKLIDKSWEELLPYLNSEEILYLRNKIFTKCRYYPDKMDIFRVFRLPLNKVNIALLGSEPYYTPGYANGLSHAVKPDSNKSFALKMIKKEIEESGNNTEWGANVVFHNDKEWKTFEHLEQQGVFLYNTALTVASGQPNSHCKYWKKFSIKTIKTLSVRNPCIWIVWNNTDRDFITSIANPIYMDKYDTDEMINSVPLLPEANYIFTATYPSADNRKINSGYEDSSVFRDANILLKRLKKTYINW